jgi:alpha-L-fucosidase
MANSRPIVLSVLLRLLLFAAPLSWAGVTLEGNSDVAASPTHPTAASMTPQQRDAQWRASESRYDSAREKWLERVASGGLAGPFRPDWTSLREYRSPKWYDEARFGIFIHWGVYSVPAFGSEWYSRNMYQEGSREYQYHRDTYGPQDRFGYRDLIPLFKAEKFDARAWARLFREAGARYVVPVAEHHDGFAMYDSQLSDWTAAKMGPKRDVLGQLRTAIREAGLHFGVSSHRAEHNWFFDLGRRIPSDVNDPSNASLYGPAQDHIAMKADADLEDDWTYVAPAWLDDWLARTAELVTRYEPELVYFDWWVGHPAFRNTVPKFLAYYYNQGATRGGVVVDYKLGGFAPNAGTLDIERGRLTDIQERVWQTDTSLSNESWGYIEHDTYKTPAVIIHLLADVVSKNGNLMLNVGPRADGTIPDEAQKTLREVGAWLKVNGEAIYASKPWTRFGEGPTAVAGGSFQETNTKPYTAEDFRFTTRQGHLYAIELGWPGNGEALIRSITPQTMVLQVRLLATGEIIPFTQDADGLHLMLPRKRPGQHAWVYRIEAKDLSATPGGKRTPG